MKDSKKHHEDEDKIKELNEKYLRALADYQNLQRQTESWKEEFVKYAGQGLIVQLLDVLDNLEKAQGHLKDGGLQLIVDKLKGILKNNGLEEVQLTGEEFDPVTAEVISVEPGDRDNIVTGVLQKGYKLNGKVIRPAKVVVSKKE